MRATTVAPLASSPGTTRSCSARTLATCLMKLAFVASRLGVLGPQVDASRKQCSGSRRLEFDVHLDHAVGVRVGEARKEHAVALVARGSWQERLQGRAVARRLLPRSPGATAVRGRRGEGGDAANQQPARGDRSVLCSQGSTHGFSSTLLDVECCGVVIHPRSGWTMAPSQVRRWFPIVAGSAQRLFRPGSAGAGCLRHVEAPVTLHNRGSTRIAGSGADVRTWERAASR